MRQPVIAKPFIQHAFPVNLLVTCTAISLLGLISSADARPVSGATFGANNPGQPTTRAAGDKAKYTSFDCTGATATRAYDINNAGYIVANACGEF